jgi:aromatic ring-opening dioxygenase LigB subunit
LKNPYQEVAWIFSRITGQESTETIPQLALYILYFTIHEQTIFDWGKNIPLKFLHNYQVLKTVRSSTWPPI